MVFEEALQNIAFGLVRIGSFAANAFLFGLPLLLLFVLRPGLARGDGEGVSAARRRVAGRLEGLVQAALWASGVGAGLTLVLQALLAADLQGGGFDAGAFSDVADSSFGRWYLLRLPLLAALAVMLAGKIRTSSTAGLQEGDDPPAPKPLWWVAWIGLALCLLSTSSFSGHASVSTPLALALVNDIVHLGSGALWFSGIVVLATVVPDAARAEGAQRRLSLVTPLVVRFSRVALASIAIVALTGTFNSLFNLETPGDLVDSGYGRLLSTKIVVFLGVIVLGAINHLYVRRRLEKAVAAQTSTSASRLFKKTIAIELTLALLLMGLTGFLVGSARTRPSAAGAAHVISAR